MVTADKTAGQEPGYGFIRRAAASSSKRPLRPVSRTSSLTKARRSHHVAQAAASAGHAARLEHSHRAERCCWWPPRVSCKFVVLSSLTLLVTMHLAFLVRTDNARRQQQGGRVAMDESRASMLRAGAMDEGVATSVWVDRGPLSGGGGTSVEDEVLEMVTTGRRNGDDRKNVSYFVDDACRLRLF